MMRQATGMRKTRGRPTPGAARAPGRPRSSDVDGAINEAAIRLLMEHGYRGLSIEGVAKEARIAKTSVYRRYRDKQDMAAAALAHLLERHGAFESLTTGDTRRDLIVSMQQLARAESTSAALAILGGMLAERRDDATVIQRLWSRVFAPHRAALVEILERGLRRGELREDVALDTAAELVMGGFLTRIISGLPADDEWTERMVTTLWDGLARRAP